MDILVFSPHPDDCEVACGGTILLSVKQGLEVVIADLSEGECSSRGSREEREKEKNRATDLLGIKGRFPLRMPDTRIGESPSHRLAIINLIREVRPTVVLAPYWDDRHPDHEAAARLVREACFYAGVASTGEGDPFRPNWLYHYMSHSPFKPSFAVDISSVWQEKSAVIEAYRTQLFADGADGRQTAISDPQFLRYHESRCVYFGAMIGVAHAEPFFSEGPLSMNGIPGVNQSRSSGRWSPGYKCF